MALSAAAQMCVEMEGFLPSIYYYIIILYYIIVYYIIIIIYYYIILYIAGRGRAGVRGDGGLPAGGPAPDALRQARARPY